MRQLRIASGLAVFFGFFGIVFTTFANAPATAPEYFAMPCAVSRMANKGQDASQKFGHAVIFLSGVCLDHSAKLPQLKLDCPAGSEDGVGLSSDAWFKNIRWLGSPGFEFFMNGNLKEDQILNWDYNNKFVDDTYVTGLMANIQSHPADWAKDIKDPVQLEKLRVMGSIGTEYALTWSRDLTCAKVPLSLEQMKSIVPYVNQLNRAYTDTGKDFHLDFMNNNCTHLVNNVLWAAGLMPKKEFEEPRPYLKGDLAIPMNVILEFYRELVLTELPTLTEVYLHPHLAYLLMIYHQLPGRDGMIATHVPIHGATNPSLNELFETQYDPPFFLDVPGISPYGWLLKVALNTPKYSMAEANRLHFVDVYTERLAELKPNAQDYGNMDPLVEVRDRKVHTIRKHPSHPYSFDQIFEAYRAFLNERLAAIHSQ